MRIKKVLSLAVVLAMVLTVVPMFGITAGAADAVQAGTTFKTKDGKVYKYVDAKNLFSNPSFETDLNGWKANDKSAPSDLNSQYYTRSEDQARDGSASMKITPKDKWVGSTDKDNLRTYVEIQPDRKYVLRFSEYWTEAVNQSNSGLMSVASVAYGYDTTNIVQAAGGWNSFENESKNAHNRTLAREAGKWIDYEYILDTSNEAVSGQETLYAVIGYCTNGEAPFYIDAFELYEVTKEGTPTTVKIVYNDEDGEVFNEEIGGYCTGDEFTTPEIATGTYYTDETKKKLYVIGRPDKNKIDSLVDGENIINVDLATYKNIVEGEPGKINLIDNPGFENDFTGWTGKTSSSDTDVKPLAAQNTNKVKLQITEDSDLVQYGSKALLTESDNSYPWIDTKWTVKANTDYYMSFMFKLRTGDNQYAWFYAGNDSNILTPEVGQHMTGQYYRFVKKEYIANSGDNTEIGFAAHYLGNSNGIYDEFKLYELASIPATVTVKYVNSDGGAEIKQETIDNLHVGDKYTFDLKEVITDNEQTYVYVPEGSDSTTIDWLKETNTITLKYKADTPEKVTDLQLKTRPGFKAELPATVDATGTNGSIFKDLNVTWEGDNVNKVPEKSELNSTYEIQGKLTDYPEVTVKAIVSVKTAEDFVIAYAGFDDADTVKVVPEGTGYQLEETGYNGKAYSFDGDKKGHVMLQSMSGQDDILLGLDEFTVTMYIKSTKGSWPFFASNKTDAPGLNTEDYIALFQNPVDTINFERYHNGRNKDTSSASDKAKITPDVWNAVALVVDKGKTYLYVNGYKVAETDKEDASIADMFDETGKSYIYLGYAPWGNGEGYTGMVDEVKIYNVALTADEVKTEKMHTVTVNYYYDKDKQQPYKTETRGVLSDSKVVFDAVDVLKDGKFYACEAKTYENVSEDKTEDIILNIDTSKAVASSVFSFNFTNKEIYAKDSSGFSGYTTRRSWGGKTDVIMTFNLPEVPAGKRLVSAKLHVYTNRVNGFNNCHKENKVRAFNADMVDVAGSTMKIESDYNENNYEDVIGAKDVSAEYTPSANNYETTDLNFENVEVGNTLALLYQTLHHDMSVAGKEDANYPYLTDIVYEDAPVDVNAYLGRSEDGELTIDFEFGELYDGATVEITREDKLEEPLTTPEGLYTAAEKVVSIVPTNSNIIYTATVKAAGENLVGTAKASLYSVVVQNIMDGTLNYSKDNIAGMVDKVNDVITKGGVYFTKENADDLNEQTAKVVQVTADASTIKVTVNSKLAEYGIGFVLNQGEVCIGSKDRTFSNAEENVYTEFTINTDDDTVTLANADSAVTLSLDSVNIEFVETLIEELEAEGADAAQDFIPEL